MNIKIKILPLIAAAAVFSACDKSEAPEQDSVSVSSVSEYAETAEASDSDFQYSVKNGEVRLDSYIGSDTVVNIPEYIDGCPVVKYSSNVFAYTDVAEITFPSTITKITAIQNAEKLETINISSSVEEIFTRGFTSCKNFKNINAEKGGKFTSDAGVLYSADEKTLVFCPHGRTGEFILPDSVEVIGDEAFFGSSLTKIAFPKGLSEIGEYAFSRCTVTKVVLPQGLSKIGNYAFYGSYLKSVVLPEGLSEIGSYAFMDTGLNEIELPEGLKTIGTYAFYQTNIREIHLPDSIENCGAIFGAEEYNSPKIFAPLSARHSEGMSDLLDYKNIVYLGETDLDTALRNIGKLREYQSGRIFMDLDGDNFPEMCEVDKYGTAEWYRFDIPDGEWKRFVYLYSDTDLNLYYDKENDEYFYLFPDPGEYSIAYAVFKASITEDGFKNYYEYDYHNSFGDFDGYSKAHYDDESGEYIQEEYVYYGYINGKFFIEENSPDFYNNVFREAMSEYELVNTVNVQKILDEHGDMEQGFEIFMGDFADSPEPSEYKKPLREKSETDYITIGDQSIPMDSQWVSIYGRDATEENFEKLSHMPRLTTLYISGYKYDEEVNMAGISKLTGLGHLSIYTDAEIKNAAEIGKLKNLKVLRIPPYADDFSFLKDMDSLAVIEFGNTVDMPEDFFKPIYEMKNLHFLLVSCWDQNVTDEQMEHVSENAPQINIIYYKRG